MHRLYSLLDKACGCKPHVQKCCKLIFVSTKLCSGNYTNSVVYNKGYCKTRVGHDSMGNYVSPIVLQHAYIYRAIFTNECTDVVPILLIPLKVVLHIMHVQISTVDRLVFKGTETKLHMIIKFSVVCSEESKYGINLY